MSTKVLLVDDHKMFREGIRSLLNQQSDIEVVGEADDGRTAVDLARRLSPQVVVIDVTMPSLNGIDATRQILMENAGIKAIALSMHAHPHFVQDMLEAGASGYLLKECAFDELVHAIRSAVEKGNIYLSEEISRLVMDDYLQIVRNQKTPGAPALSTKEREVLQLVAEGNTSEEIAELVHMSRRTVEKHRASIMSKLKIDSLAELVKYAIRKGITKP